MNTHTTGKFTSKNYFSEKQKQCEVNYIEVSAQHLLSNCSRLKETLFHWEVGFVNYRTST